MSKSSPFAALAATLLIGLTALAAKPAWTCYLDVSPLMGETTSSKSGSSLRTLGTSSSSSKTITRNMRWRADVRVRGKGRPEKSELRVFYIAYHDDDMKPYIIKKEKHPLKLAAEGKDSIELTSPTTRLTKKRTRTSSSTRGGFRSTHSSTTGERIGGCIIQLVVNGKVTRIWTSNSSWEKVSWDDPFTEESLTRKPHNSLN